MEEDHKKRKIVLIVGFSFVVIILLLLIVLGIFSQKTATTISKQPISTVRPTGGTGQSPQVVSKTNWIVGQGSTYMLEYPSDWHVSVTSVSGGGTAATFQSLDDIFPRFYIEATATESATPIGQRLQALSWMHLPQSTVKLQGVIGIMLSGTVPMRPLPDNLNQNSISKTYVFIEKNGMQYVITETYYNDTNAKNNARLLETILSSIQFQ